MNRLIGGVSSLVPLIAIPLIASATEPPTSTALLLKPLCFECHNKEITEGDVASSSDSITGSIGMAG